MEKIHFSPRVSTTSLVDSKHMVEKNPTEKKGSWIDKGGFKIRYRLDGSEGHGVKVIDVVVHTSHPEKKIADKKRIYNVLTGRVNFVVNGKNIAAFAGDTVTLSEGDVYSYKKATGLRAVMYEVCVL